MAWFLRRWRWRHLFASWIVYWAVLAIAALWRPVSIARRLADLPDAEASISASVTNTVLSITMTAQGTSVWTTTISLLTIVLWLAGPPLLLWILWATSRPSSATARATDSPEGPSAVPAPGSPALGDGVAFADQLARSRAHGEAMGIRRDREAR